MAWDDEDKWQGDDFWWGEPYTPDFYRCTECGLIFWKPSWIFSRCPWCQRSEIVEFGGFNYMRPRSRKFLRAGARIA